MSKEDRGWSTESHEQYMARRRAEEEIISKQKSPKATDQQVGGNHYKGYAIQPIHFIMENDLGFCEGNILKYITRWKDKGGVEDLRKAKHYMNMLIESALEKEK
jgi:hypothetical protein|tara:strand:+ start:164 stop:475 length:312 start_codon:yes stop_codon:yes gene_type:complete